MKCYTNESSQYTNLIWQKKFFLLMFWLDSTKFFCVLRTFICIVELAEKSSLQRKCYFFHNETVHWINAFMCEIVHVHLNLANRKKWQDWSTHQFRIWTTLLVLADPELAKLSLTLLDWRYFSLHSVITTLVTTYTVMGKKDNN